MSIPKSNMKLLALIWEKKKKKIWERKFIKIWDFYAVNKKLVF